MVRTLTTIALLIATVPSLAFGQQSWAPEQAIPGFNPLVPSAPSVPHRLGTRQLLNDSTAKTQARKKQPELTSRKAENHNESWRIEQSSNPAGDQTKPNEPDGGENANESASSDAPLQPPVVLSTALPTQYRVRQLPTTASSLAAPLTNLQTPQNFAAQPRLPMINGPATGQFSFGNQIPNAAIVPQRPRRSVNIAPPPRSRALQLRSAGGGCVIQGSRRGFGSTFAPTTFVPF